MHLQGAAGEPGAGVFEGRPLHDREAEQVSLIVTDLPQSLAFYQNRGGAQTEA
jgi:hypothetical protein